ncbi:Xaa-Pro peptidase family protein [Oscillospiraceae bacterium OttesenSCG-928-G22]|nr:Xaa-Pro peptidase family protein [Oscillospiraceae bacterium OttesenSCG-928-G22]
MQPTKRELTARLARFIDTMTALHPDWETALILSKVNQYYFTGTMQNALLLIRRDGSFACFVRKSFDRAKAESPLSGIYPMRSYRDAAASFGAACGVTYFEADTVPYAVIERVRQYFDISELRSLEGALGLSRARKSPYELAIMEEAGERHTRVLLEDVPALLREGMTEAEFFGELYLALLRRGHHGISRFSRFQTEIVVGQIAFGENSLAPTSFDGPGGQLGVGPAAPLAGNHTRRLTRGDLVFVDFAFGLDGYHTDKTQVYSFGGEPANEAATAHRFCMDIQATCAAMLRPGAIPADIYRDTLAGTSADDLKYFMGSTDPVKFLGHGVGLHVDESPVIAAGIDTPLEEGMAIALEPKKGVPGIGMVGVEETYLVTPSGGRCITGGAREIIPVY